MGEDIHIVIEHRSEDGRWECAMEIHDLGRNYKVFNKIKEIGYFGLPENVASWTRHLIEPECYGFGWLPMEDFCKIKHIKAVVPGLRLISKKKYKDLRVVYSFDH